MNDYPEWATLREIDHACGAAKGAAFRAFKAHAPSLREGVDFSVLNPSSHRQQIEALRAAGRIYTGSVNVVLLSPATRRKLLAALQ